jgi:hypothetical protein
MYYTKHIMRLGIVPEVMLSFINLEIMSHSSLEDFSSCKYWLEVVDVPANYLMHQFVQKGKVIHKLDGNMELWVGIS